MRTRNLFLLLSLALLTAALAHGQGFSSSQSELPKFQPPASTFALPPAPAPRPKPTPPGMVEGRSTDVHWELEFHGGGFLAPQLTDTPRPLLLGLAPFNGPEGTYFFGNGAAHANSVLSGFSLATTPFDNALIRDQVNRQQGYGGGFRLSYDFNQRWGVEWTFDYNHGGLAMTDYTQALAGTTATTTATAFTALLQVANPASTSTVVTAIAPDEGHQFFNTITLQYYLRKEGKFIPYLEVGGGLLNNFGGMPAVNFTNTLTIPGSPDITEVDHMVVRYDPSPVAGVLTVGAGFKYYAGSNWGIRMDLRDNMAWESYQTQVWTMPVITTSGVNSVTAFNAGTGSSMVFANNGTSTLQPASAIRGLRTFQNDRLKHYLVPTIGIFWRF